MPGGGRGDSRCSTRVEEDQRKVDVASESDRIPGAKSRLITKACWKRRKVTRYENRWRRGIMGLIYLEPPLRSVAGPQVVKRFKTLSEDREQHVLGDGTEGVANGLLRVHRCANLTCLACRPRRNSKSSFQIAPGLELPNQTSM
jgi:hypothetical protein